MAKTIEIIKGRVSCRAFNEKKVSPKKLMEILEAGRSAPSACNRQIASITAVRKASNFKALKDLSQKLQNRDCMYGASTIVLVHAPREDAFCAQDCSCILENIFVAAAALKIDSCWINQFDELFNTSEGLKLKKKLRIPAENRVVGSAALGFRKDGLKIDVKNKSGIEIVIK